MAIPSATSRSLDDRRRAIFQLPLAVTPRLALAAVGPGGAAGEGRVGHGGRAVAGQTQLHQTVEVVEHLRVPHHAGAPVAVDAVLELDLGLVDLRLQAGELGGVDGRVSGVLGVERVEGQGGEVGGVCGSTGAGAGVEVVEDVIAGVGYDPFSARRLSA